MNSRQVALSSTDWFRLVATHWQTVSVHKLDINYLQSLPNLFESESVWVGPWLFGDRLLPIRWLVQSPCGQMQSSTGWACCNTEPLVAAATCYWSSKAKKEKKEPNDPNHWLFLVAVFNLLCLSYKSAVGFHKLLRPKPNELYVFNKKFRIKWYTQTIQLR